MNCVEKKFFNNVIGAAKRNLSNKKVDIRTLNIHMLKDELQRYAFNYENATTLREYLRTKSEKDIIGIGRAIQCCNELPLDAREYWTEIFNKELESRGFSKLPSVLKTFFEEHFKNPYFKEEMLEAWQAYHGIKPNRTVANAAQKTSSAVADFRTKVNALKEANKELIVPATSTPSTHSGIDEAISGGYSKDFPKRNAASNVVQKASSASADYRTKVNVLKEANKELIVPATSTPSTHSGIDEAISGGYSKDFPKKKE